MTLFFKFISHPQNKITLPKPLKIAKLNLHPTSPRSWKKAINFPHTQPNFAKKFKYNIKFKTPNLKEKTDNFIYDIKVLSRAPRYLMRKIKTKLFK